MRVVARVAADYWPEVVAHLWSSTIFLALVLLALLLVRSRLTASARFALVFIGILKFAIPAAPLTRLIRSITPMPVVRAVPMAVLAGAFPPAPAGTEHSVWPAILLAIWIAAALAIVVRFSLTRHRLVSLATRTALPPNTREAAALDRARRSLGIASSIDIARCAFPEAPAVLRIFRPVVVLPADGCDDLSDGELESLLRHECAHVARHDNAIARIESLVAALFWFHPLIWIAQRIAAVERERACDEAVASDADERKTYLAALYKFCHASIAPRLPGVSCMATAKLKERIDHIMNYPALKALSPPTRRVASLASFILFLFTFASALVAVPRASSGDSSGDKPYKTQFTAHRNGNTLEIVVSAIDNRTQEVVAQPKLILGIDGPGARAKAGRTLPSGWQVEVEADAVPDHDHRHQFVVSTAIRENGNLVQQEEIGSAGVYTGQPISLSLLNADLRDVFGTFAKLTGTDIQVDPGIEGTVSVSWKNVPWDEAFDSLLEDHGLTYKMEGKVIHVSKK
ncbi:MAG TPA: M56 family metallopeptidase [Thermoanaerobaculia bacterium]|nr:M56 family metallopeptidase [Thermoanaerobaculia bacterium]